jgi:hypothetical protein
MPTVSIACGKPDIKPVFVVSALARLWQQRGISAHIGPGFLPDSDVGILHIDKTQITDADLPARANAGPVVNWSVRDISKRRVSPHLVTRDDPWDGSVIVKTNRNYYGTPEETGHKLTPADRNRRRMAELSWRYARSLPHKHYPIVSRISIVPRWVWDDESLVVERFTPERDGDLYCLRGWMFFGSRSYGWRLRATDPLVKSGSQVDHSYLTEVPDELLAIRKRHGFDFGKFDYVVHDGKPVVFDLNKTPTFTGDGNSPRLTDLSLGIEDFL